ncbi:MAG TPA: radical SAM protein [Elusimicrobiales bacterium]|nr:radical SAM protein [Elusimicrobiales bacterium]
MSAPEYYPDSAALEVTLKCNMSCRHCGSDAGRADRKNSLSLEEWKGVVDELKAVGTRHITLSGGEPFLYPHYRELISHIISKGIQGSFISNGLSLTEKDIVFLKEAGVSHLAVSLDGNEKVHDYIRQTKGSYKKIMELLDLAGKHGFNVFPVTSVNKLNFEVREEILAALLERKTKCWQVQIVNSFGRAGKFRDEMLIEKSQYAVLCEDISRWQKQHKGQLNIATADSIGYCHPLTDEMLGDFEWQGCNAGMYVVGIESDGAVKGCLSLQDKKFHAGNVRERKFSEIWKDDSCFAYTRRYDPSKMQGRCAACEAAQQCKAGCLGMAYSVTGSIYENSYCYKAIKEQSR